MAAVRLGKVDRSMRTTAVQVIIMSPLSSGGSLCEGTALRAVEVLQGMGGTCIKDVCKFDEMAGVFYIEISAEFFGTALEDDWSAGPGYAVSIGIQPLEHVVLFQSEQKINDEIAAIADAPWQLVIEELLPLGASEPAGPREPFELTVSRKNSDEIFSGCSWISIRREDTIRGVSQIRTASAASRTFLSVL